MPYITEIRADAPFNIAIQNFAVACDANKVALGLTVPQLAEIAGTTATYVGSLSTVAAAKSAVTAAVEAKDAASVAAHAMVSKWAKTFRANLSVPDSILGDLTVAPHSTPSSLNVPNVPSTLEAISDTEGNIRLQWSRNGNIQNTQFVIEYRTSNTSPWTQLGTCTKRTFDTTWTPGTYVAYRVYALRRGVASVACSPLSLWDIGSEMTLKLAA